MPPTPQPSTPRPLTIGVCESVPTSVSGYAISAVGPVAGEHDPREILEIDLVTDAGIGRHDQKIVERVLGPPQELVTLAVAIELQLGIDSEGVTPCEHISDDRVVDHQLNRNQRVDPPRITSQRDDRVAHRDEVDNARHTGEVLQQHAGWGELDLDPMVGRRIPRRERVDLVRGHGDAVFASQQVLEQDLQAVGKPC